MSNQVYTDLLTFALIDATQCQRSMLIIIIHAQEGELENEATDQLHFPLGEEFVLVKKCAYYNE